MSRRLSVWTSLVVTAAAVLSVHAAIFGGSQETSLGLQPKLAEAAPPAEDALSPAGEFAAETPPAPESQIETVYGGLPIHFEPNEGQTDPRVAFLSRGPGYSLFLTADQIALSLTAPAAAGGDLSDPREAHEEDVSGEERAPSSVPTDVRGRRRTALGMKLLGASTDPIIEGLDELAAKSNYFIGPKEDHVTGVPHYTRVAYRDVYPGIDLVLYGKQGLLEYDFVVGAGADPEQIELGIRGAEGVSIDDNGNLVVSVPGGEMLQHAPFVYQERSDGTRVPVVGRYRLRQEGPTEFHVGFQVEAYDEARTLVIDPVLSYSTYLGGTLNDSVYDLVADSSGNTYVTGYTTSTDFPTESAFQPAYAGGTSFVPSDAFVSKISPDGSSLVYSTYIGTNQNDSAVALAVDSSGSAYITGVPGSASWPTAWPTGSNLPSSFARFYVTKFSPAGDTLVYSHWLGGAAASDTVHDIAVDSSGNAYVTGRTASGDFPTANAYQPSMSGTADAFLMKINAAGSAFLYSTYLGGSGNGDQGRLVAADATGNAYLAGETHSSDFPTVSAAQPDLSGLLDVFIAKLSADGASLTYSTYLGGSVNDYPWGIAFNSGGNAFVTGKTFSSNFPTAGTAPDSWPGDSASAFVTALSVTGSSFIYSGYLGGSANDSGEAISIDPDGRAHVVGTTISSDFPTVNAYQGSIVGSENDAFHTVFAADGSIAESTYIGTSVRDSGVGIDARWEGAVFLAGLTSSTSFPTLNALQPTFAGGNESWIMKFCDWSIDPTGDAFTYAAGGDTVDVTAGPGCGWTAVSNDSWITVTGGAAGSGSDTVTYTVDENPTIVARQGTMTIAGATFTVDQGGAPCTYGLSPTSDSFSQNAAVDSVAVTTLTGCPWTAVSNDSWIHVTGGASGSDSGTVNYSVDQNTTAGIRAGSMTIAGHSFPVDQAAGTAPVDPSGLAVASSSATQVGLSWVDNAGDETEYRVERKEGAAGAFAQIATLAAGSQTYIDPTVKGQTNYTYHVLACNLVGCSNPSNEVSLTTPGLAFFIGEPEAEEFEVRSSFERIQ